MNPVSLVSPTRKGLLYAGLNAVRRLAEVLKDMHLLPKAPLSRKGTSSGSTHEHDRH